jgi:predicted nucleic acid-binding protein
MGAASRMTRAILDTSVVISSGDEEAVLRALPAESAISVATLAELHFGVELGKTPAIRARRLQHLGAIESAFEALPIDAHVARAYATVAHAVVGVGRKPRARVMDLWIASTALVHGVPLFTRNPTDFAGLASLIDVHTV